MRFFAKDVWAAWHKWTKQTVLRIRDHIRIFLDGDDLPEKPVSTQAIRQAADDAHLSTIKDAEDLSRVGALQIGYTALKCNLQKSVSLLESDQSIGCTICRETLRPDRDLILVCSDAKCHMTAHLNCLSKYFLSVENKPDALVPIDGVCPECEAKLYWPDLLKDLTLRTRGQAEMKLLSKIPREIKSKHLKSKETAPLAEDGGNDRARMVASNSILPTFILPRCIDDNSDSSSETEDDGLVYRDIEMDHVTFDDIDEVMSVDSDVSDDFVSGGMQAAPSTIAHNYTPAAQSWIAASRIVIPDSDGWDAIEEVLE